jgi:hypothetical protein
MSRLEAGLYGAADTASFGTADEIRAGIRGGIDALRTGQPLGEAYDARLAESRGMMRDAREDRSGAFIAGQVAGGLVAPISGGPVRAGATVGAAYGLGSGEGAGDRLQGAAVGGAIGGAIGAILGPVVTGVTRAFGLRGKAAEDRARQMIETALKRDGIDPANLGALAQPGKPLTVADLGPNTRGLVGAASRQAGEGREILNRFFEDRTVGQFGRMSDDLAAGMGADAGEFASTGADIAARRAAAAGPAYRAAYGKPAPALSKSGQAVLATPAGKAAVARATTMMGNRQAAAKDGAGNYTVEMLDQIQRALRDMETTRKRAGAAEMAGNLGHLRSRLLAELPNDLRTVMANYRAESELIDALNAGRTFMRGDVEAVAAAVANMTPQQRDLFRLGAARQLRGMLGAKADGADATTIVQNPAMRERLAAIFPDAASLDTFLGKAATEKTMQATRNAILKGSPTAERLGDDAGFAQSAGEIVGDIASGRGVVSTVLGAGARATRRGVERVARGVNENVARGVARVATDTDLDAVGRELLAARLAQRTGMRNALARGLSASGVSELNYRSP